MIKSGLKNYFVNLKYYFTPIGTLAVGMVLGLSILIPSVLAVISSLGEQIILILDNKVDFTPAKDYLVSAVTSLDWSDPISSLKTMFTRSWLDGVISDSFNIIVSELEEYSVQITDAVSDALVKIKALVAVFISFSVLGLICGYILTKFLVRRNMAKRSFLKFLLATFLGAILSSGLIIFCVWLSTVWSPSVYLTTLLTLIAFSSASLLGAYLVHGAGKVRFRQVLNFKNILKLLLVNFIIFYISVIFVFIAVALTNVIAGLFIGFAFIEIAFIVISLNAENYVQGLAVINMQ